MRAYILRHGETDWNVRQVFQGQTDTRLNEKGIQEAYTCRKRVEAMGLTFDAAVSSPLSRAVKTVEIVSGFPREKIPTDRRLLEMNFGPLDGTPFRKDSPVAGNLFTDPGNYIPPEGAESFHQVVRRVGEFLSDLAENPPGESVLVGAHGCCMRCMLVALGEIPMKSLWEQGVGNCTIFELQSGENGKLRLKKIYGTDDVFEKG